MLDDLQLSSEKQKGSKLSLFQKVKLLSYVSKKPITSSRPASALHIYSLEMLYLPTISHLNYIEDTRPTCIEGIVNRSRRCLQYVTTTRLVSKALAHLPAHVREVSCMLAASVVFVLHPTVRWRLAGFSAVARSPGAWAWAVRAGCKALCKLTFWNHLSEIWWKGVEFYDGQSKYSECTGRRKSPGRGDQRRDRRC